MRKQLFFVFYTLLLILGCNSTSSNIEATETAAILENIPGIISSTSTTTEVTSEKSIEETDSINDKELDFTVDSVFPSEQVVELTAVEIYQNYLNTCNLEIVSTPKQVSKNKKFTTNFSVKCTKDGSPLSNILVTVKYPVAQTNGVIAFGQTIIETDEEGIASFSPTDTSFSCNSNVYFFLTPETEDSETLEFAEKNSIAIPYKVITNRFWDSGVLALIDYNASNRSLSTNTTATALQPPLRKAGFQTIGNAPFDASIVTGKNLYSEAKAIFGSTVSFMLYGIVKYAEPAQKLEDGQYIVTFVTDFSVMNLRDGKIVYHEEFFTTETGASEWDATNKLRTKIIPEIITEKVIYGI